MNFALCSWWRSPYDVDMFEQLNWDLALLDNVRDYNESRKLNFISLDQLVNVGSINDNGIIPWKSQFFGYFKDNSYTDYWEFDERPEYGEDFVRPQNT